MFWCTTYPQHLKFLKVVTKNNPTCWGEAFSDWNLSPADVGFLTFPCRQPSFFLKNTKCMKSPQVWNHKIHFAPGAGCCVQLTVDFQWDTFKDLKNRSCKILERNNPRFHSPWYCSYIIIICFKNDNIWIVRSDPTKLKPQNPETLVGDKEVLGYANVTNRTVIIYNYCVHKCKCFYVHTCSHTNLDFAFNL